MSAPGRTGTADASLTRDILYAVRYYLGGRRGLLILAGGTLAAGLALNWSWLVAVGAAPLLIAALPCVAMCALGLCMNRTSGQSCDMKAGSGRAAEPPTDDTRPDMRTAAADISRDRPADVVAGDPAIAPVPISEPRPVRERSQADA